MSKARELSCIRRIDALIMERYGLSRRALAAVGRMQPHTEARQLAMWLLRKYTGLSLPQIARRYGNMDHSTVHYAASVVPNWTGGRAMIRDSLVGEIEAAH